MDRETRTRRISRLIATLVVIATILASVYGALPSRRTSLSSGYINEFPGNGLVRSSGSGITSGESEKASEPVVHGSLIDDEGKPVQGLEVELIPADKKADNEWYGSQSAWSDRSGEYEFKNLPSGEYFVGVHHNEAPDGEHPFQTVYYPGVSAQADAQKIYVGMGDRVSLQWMRLRRIKVVAIPISFQWQDGQAVERGNLLFNNLSYPHSAPVGGFAPEIDKGEGAIILPEGFEYTARAKVDCDAGSKIETIESRPIQRFKVDGNEHPEKLTFVIPASSCKLWRPAS